MITLSWYISVLYDFVQSQKYLLKKTTIFFFLCLYIYIRINSLEWEDLNPKCLHWKYKEVSTSWVIRFLKVWNKLCAWDSAKWTWTSCKVYIFRLATMNKCNILELSLSSWLVLKLSLEQDKWSLEQMKAQVIIKVDYWRLHFNCRLD